MKIFLAASFLCLAASFSSAAGTDDGFLDAVAGFKAALPACSVPAAATAPAAKPKTALQSFVSVSGQVRLEGSGYVPPGSRWVNVNLTGWTDIQDNSGGVRSGMTNVSYMGNFFLNGNWVNDWARPYVTVSLYKDGRYVGSASVNGSIFVSGMLSGGWVNISGSGTLSGSASIND